MSNGINISGSKNITVRDCKIAGYETGINAADSEGIDIDSTHIISKEALMIYGPEFLDVYRVVYVSKDKSAIAALTTIQEEPQPDKAVNAWVTVIKKFRKELGNFTSSTLPKVLSASAYALLKTELSKYGITLP